MSDDPNASAPSTRAEDTWFSRELPVLVAIVALAEREDFVERVTYQAIIDETGFGHETVVRAIDALKGTYIDTREYVGGLRTGRLTAILPAARVAAGQWPSETSLAERLLDVLEAQAQSAPTEVERSKLSRLRSDLVATGTDLVAKVIGELVGSHLPRM